MMHLIYNKPVLFALISSLLFISITVSGFPGEPEFNSNPDYAQVTGVRMVSRGEGTWDIHVTVMHNDQGWDHYADIWQILDHGTGLLIGERILAHPHDTEQPFTRSLTGLRISQGTESVRIRSRCPIHGFGGKEVILVLPDYPAERGVEIISP